MTGKGKSPDTVGPTVMTERMVLDQELKELPAGLIVGFDLYDPDDYGRLNVKGKIIKNAFGVFTLNLDSGERDYELSHHDVKSYSVPALERNEDINWDFDKGDTIYVILKSGLLLVNVVQAKGEKMGRRYVKIGNGETRGLRPIFENEIRDLKVVRN